MIIYKSTNKINGKCYIGKTVQNLKRRITSHLSHARNNKKGKFLDAIRKYGKGNFEWEIICECSNEQELANTETKYIEKINSVNNGYNASYGSYGNIHSTHKSPNISPELRKQMMDKIIPQISGNNHYLYGKKYEDYHGKEKSEEIKFKQRKWMIKNNPMLSEKSRNKLAKIYKIITPNNEKIIIENLAQFCRDNNLSYISMRRVSYNEQKHHKKYKVTRLSPSGRGKK